MRGDVYARLLVSQCRLRAPISTKSFVSSGIHTPLSPPLLSHALVFEVTTPPLCLRHPVAEPIDFESDHLVLAPHGRPLWKFLYHLVFSLLI